MRRRGCVCVLVGIAIGMFPAAAAADGPGVGTATVVTLGDSAISGEAGRWAGNTNDEPSQVDALGAGAYHDAQGGESIPGCHRSKAAQAHIGGGVASANLACSGARTSTGGTGGTRTSSRASTSTATRRAARARRSRCRSTPPRTTSRPSS